MEERKGSCEQSVVGLVDVLGLLVLHFVLVVGNTKSFHRQLPSKL